MNIDLPSMPYFCRVTALLVCCSSFCIHAAELWELPPLRYSETQAHDPFAQLMADVEAGKKTLPRHHSQKFLLALLKELDVPVESQVLVFSKTSKQVQLISPGNPRAIYFSDNTYVAWVPGGKIEVIAHDSVLGPVFYEMDPSYAGGKVNYQRSGTCLACHVPVDAEGAIGLTLRSSTTMANGTPSHIVESSVNHGTPYSKRWGGWYITGGVDGLSHLGNMVGKGKDGLKLKKLVPAGRYPHRGSDVVALMVLDHQAYLYTLFTKASMHYRRAYWLEEALAKHGGPAPGSKGTISATLANRMAEEIVEYMLFCHETPLPGDGVSASDAFVTAFQKNARRVGVKRRSLKDMRLYGHLFKYRCSYMIDSHGFRDLPMGVKSVVIKRILEVLNGKDTSGRFDHLGGRERARILEIIKPQITKS